jgi:nucleotide-binding universal stress UspA family protein
MKTIKEPKRSTSPKIKRTTTQTRAELLTTTKPSSPLRKLKRILVPIDFSEPSLKALRYAVPFAEESGATISLVHIREPVAYPVDIANVSPPPVSGIEEAEAKGKLYDLAYHEIEELVPIDVHVRSGKAADEIVNLAKALETDLIIIATHGYKGFMRFVMGSTAEKVVRHAPCPVLVVREKEHEFV